MSSKMVASGQKVMVVPVRPRGAGPTHLQLGLGLAAVGELHAVVLAVEVDLEQEPARQGVDDRHADAVEATGDLVAGAAELAAGVQHGEDHFGRRLVFGLGHGIHRDAASVVDHPAPAVGQQGHVDPGAVAGHGLVDGVVDDLPHQVVEARGTGGPDVHARPLADRIEAFEDGDVLGRICGAGEASGDVLRHLLHRHGRDLSDHGFGALRETKTAGQVPETRWV